MGPENRDDSHPTSVVTLGVEGMHCESCVRLIEETLLEDVGVTGARVDLAAGRVVVDYDPVRHSVDDLCAAIAAAGYAVTSRLV